MRLFDLSGALLFYGALAGNIALQRHAENAVLELAARGYAVPRHENPVRVYPQEGAGTDARAYSPIHAAAWRPGVIFLRSNPEGRFESSIYLRHEIFHEASFRTCGGKIPLWAEEAGAMAFSGEVAGQDEDGEAGDFSHLKRRVRSDSPLDALAYRELRQLVQRYGWPAEPCAVSAEIAEILKAGTAQKSELEYYIGSAISGREFMARGESRREEPPGSALKLIYAAALQDVSTFDVGKHLQSSDTEALYELRNKIDWAALQNYFPEDLRSSLNKRDVRSMLGERNADGNFDLEFTLEELFQSLRLALVSRSDAFRAYRGGSIESTSTLVRASSELKRLISEQSVIFKTGTVSNERGDPVVGHFAAAWPAKDPQIIAVFRKRGERGARVAELAAPVLREFIHGGNFLASPARVRILSRLEPGSGRYRSRCGKPLQALINGTQWLVSPCGEFLIEAIGPAVRRERVVRGMISDKDGVLYLRTDPETYADAVIAAEGDELQGAARDALRAVITWNALHARARHADDESLCDSTHCMVFLGDAPDGRRKSGVLTRANLMKLLDSLMLPGREAWLQFSRGGVEKWERSIPATELARMVQEPAIISLQRERTREGAVMIHLVYPESAERVSCETFRLRTALPSCPESIRADSSEWRFSGRGVGHGQGLDLEAARLQAEAGKDAADILRMAYGGKNPFLNNSAGEKD